MGLQEQIGALDLGAAEMNVRLVDDPKAQLEEMDFQDFEVVLQYFWVMDGDGTEPLRVCRA